MPPMKILPPCFAAIAARAAPLRGMLRIVPVEALVVAIEPKGLLVITSVKASGLGQQAVYGKRQCATTVPANIQL
jgi:hypothetical protein